jgi:hypothetical protein
MSSIELRVFIGNFDHLIPHTFLVITGPDGVEHGYGLAPYMDASRVASGVFEVLTWRINCGLISGLCVQAGLRGAAGLDGHSRGRGLSLGRTSHKASPRRATALPTHGLTALPSLRLLLSHTRLWRQPLVWIALAGPAPALPEATSAAASPGRSLVGRTSIARHSCARARSRPRPFAPSCEPAPPLPR